MGLGEAIDWLGEGVVLTLGSLIVGLTFGILAQRSRFCLRAAIIEFFRGSIGASVSVWLLTFFAAVSATQILIATDLLVISEARQLASAGSLSGAIIGGLLFGMGMVMARGCASRLLVLAGTGNLRSFMTGLVLTVTAQASLSGILSPAREFLSGLWTVNGGAERDLMAIFGLSYDSTLAIGLIGMAGAIYYAVVNKIRFWRSLGAIGVGLMIAVGWWFTYSMSYQSFEPVQVMSITLIGPSADTLMTLINHPTIPMDFNLGLVPGIFFGAMLAASLSGTLKMECFDDQRRMPRYIGGAVLMGFGGMLAGGCAVGAGVSGSTIFSLTAWVALASMWLGAGLTDYLVDRKRILVVSLPEIPNEGPPQLIR
jgi:uncharacterized protein